MTTPTISPEIAATVRAALARQFWEIATVCDELSRPLPWDWQREDAVEVAHRADLIARAKSDAAALLAVIDQMDGSPRRADESIAQTIEAAMAVRAAQRERLFAQATGGDEWAKLRYMQGTARLPADDQILPIEVIADLYGSDPVEEWARRKGLHLDAPELVI